MAEANDTTEQEQNCKANAQDGTCLEENDKDMKVPKVDNDFDSVATNIEHLQCGTYLAESSIPNSGWGMYTAVELKKGDQIGPLDVTVTVSDYEWYMGSRHADNSVPQWLMDQYYWNPRFGGTSYEAFEAISIIPGLGMLANSHTGLVNSENLGTKEFQGPGDRRKPETGAYSYHSSLKFESNKHLPAGMELFVAYGDEWFSDRSHIFGHDLPLSDDFEQGDRYFKHFFDTHHSHNEGQYNKWRQTIGSNSKIGPRMQKAIPQTYHEALHIHENLNGSTAMHSVPDVVRPISWLQENGLCLDHLEMGDSTIEGAGKGAFASRDLPKGTIVSPAPVVHLSQAHLEVLLTNPDDKHEVYYKGHQLLLNYVYGHPLSSLVFYPYSPASNLINHGSAKDANVELRWSSRQTHPEWLEWTTQELLQENKATGLMMEFVATRDIQQGEEILVNYGKDWEEAWKKHVQEWVAPENTGTYQPAHDFQNDEFIRIPGEEAPYPSNVNFACWLDEMADPAPGTDAEIWLDTGAIKWEMDFYRYTEETYRCKVLERNSEQNTYTAMYEWLDEDDNIVYTKVTRIPRRAIIFVDEPYTGDQYLRKAFRHYLELPDEMVPQPWRDREKPSSPAQQCQLYVAESAIPNSGLGMFTAVDIEENDKIFYSDLAVQVEDLEVNNKLHHWFTHTEPGPLWMLDHYYWNAANTGGYYEASDIQSIVPGLGMLANSHTGLVNSDMRLPTVDVGLDRLSDPGVGASTNYHNVNFLANQHIPAGMELFVEYGDTWFDDRKEELGIIPLSADFDQADKILEKFWGHIKGDPTTKFAQDLWEIVLHNETKGDKNSERIRVALPRELQEVEHVVKIGTAANSVPTRQRSIEWLEENGQCLDNIRPDVSTILQAGRGAFATRFLAKGSIITPLPMVHIHRRHMEIYDSDDFDDETKKPWWLGRQQLLNYCYGHPKSNMLLFPYSPVSNYINHDHSNYNAKLQWSTKFGQNHRDWLERSVEDLMTTDHAGIVMEVIATRDIEEGEEVLLDYGKEWEDAWKEYVTTWQSPPEAEGFVPAARYNDYFIPVKTMKEEETDPYPHNVRTWCFCPNLKASQSPIERDDGLEQYEWKYNNGLFDTADAAYPCDVWYRYEKADKPTIVDSIQSPHTTKYMVRVERDEKTDWVVSNVPRRAIHFYDDEYTSDLFLRKAFRHEIGVPDDVFPKAWMDLNDSSTEE